MTKSGPEDDVLTTTHMLVSGIFRQRTTLGVTTPRATSGGGRNDRNTSGQRGNKFYSSYRDTSVVVAENNSDERPKCSQFTSLNKM